MNGIRRAGIVALGLAIVLLMVALTGCGPQEASGTSVAGDAQALIEQARADLEAERYTEAVSKLEQALRQDDRVAEAHFLLGNAYARQNQFAQAEQEYLRALELDTEHSDARSNLGVVLYQQGKYDRAREAFETVLRNHPDDAEVHYNLGGVLAAMNRFDEAIEHFQRATVLNPQLAEPYLGLGSVYQLQGKKEQAIAALKQYLQRATDETWRRQAEQKIREMGGEP
ncbi:MAG: tetratricopeptide repeat protein [Chloroflexi bacterium]|nr:tetratricopeptide repeat protein [Chloroflexota bacterium]